MFPNCSLVKNEKVTYQSKKFGDTYKIKKFVNKWIVK